MDAPSLRTSPPPLPADGKAVGIVLAATAFIGDVLLIGISRGLHGEPPELLVCLAMAWFTSGLGLLSVWLGLGRGPVYLRLLIAAIPGVLLILIGSEGRWSIEVFAGFALFVVAVALPFGLLRLCGFELLIAKPANAAASDALDELGRGQFSLRQMFGWTLAASLVASVGRFLDLPAREWMVWGVLPVLFSLGALATACVALMPRTRTAVGWLATVLGVVSPPLVLATGCLMAGGRTPNAEEAFWFSFTTDAHVLFMLGALLIYRRLGYRLTRRTSLPVTVAVATKPAPIAAAPPEQARPV